MISFFMAQSLMIMLLFITLPPSLALISFEPMNEGDSDRYDLVYGCQLGTLVY